MVDKSIENVLGFKLLEVLDLMIDLRLNIKFRALLVNNLEHFAPLPHSLSEENLLSTQLNLKGLGVLNDLDLMHLLLLV